MACPDYQGTTAATQVTYPDPTSTEPSSVSISISYVLPFTHYIKRGKFKAFRSLLHTFIFFLSFPLLCLPSLSQPVRLKVTATPSILTYQVSLPQDREKEGCLPGKLGLAHPRMWRDGGRWQEVCGGKLTSDGQTCRRGNMARPAQVTARLISSAVRETW